MNINYYQAQIKCVCDNCSSNYEGYAVYYFNENKMTCQTSYLKSHTNEYYTAKHPIKYYSIHLIANDFRIVIYFPNSTSTVFYESKTIATIKTTNIDDIINYLLFE